MFMLSFLALVLPVAQGFRSTTNAPFALPIGPDGDGASSRGSRQTKVNDDWGVVYKTRNRVNKPKYDLGIGKNKPVNFIQGPQSFGQASYLGDSGEFIVEHESVNDMPSPLVNLQQNNNANKEEPPKRVLPKVQPKRKAQDLLHIRDHLPNDGDTRLRHPVMIPLYNFSAGKVTLDLNTIWVEMMLHSEYSKCVVN
jgi:hypothetical protein